MHPGASPAQSDCIWQNQNFLQKLSLTGSSFLYWLFCLLSSLFCFAASGWPATAWGTQNNSHTTCRATRKSSIRCAGVWGPSTSYSDTGGDQDLRKTGREVQVPVALLHPTDTAFRDRCSPDSGRTGTRSPDLLANPRRPQAWLRCSFLLDYGIFLRMFRTKIFTKYKC